MNFDTTETQEMIAKSIQDFAAREIKPYMMD